MINNELNASGYDLYEISPTYWIFDKKNGDTYGGSLKDIVFYMCKTLGFSSIEVTDALEYLVDEQLLKPEINAIHFGVNGFFIFTFEKKLEEIGKAS